VSCRCRPVLGPKQNLFGDAKVGLTLNRISADCADCPARPDRRHDVDA
jgi:hypothetical protein